jgi:transcriptional regulator with XRE-family HTH domain
VNPIERLCKYIKMTHPRASANLTPPLAKEGVWTLDVALNDKQIVITWSLATGFGFSSLDYESYGERPDEQIRSLEDAQRRISRLLTSDERTSPSLGVLLSRLRETRGHTQQELAARLGIRQATVSGMERRSDIQFSTLRRVINALGGDLEIVAVFPETEYRLVAHSVDFCWESQPICSAAQAVEGISNYEEAFEALHESGELVRAKRVAREISSRHAVLEIP